MIKPLANQKEIEIFCPKTNKQNTGYQSVNINLPSHPPFGRILCKDSDKCDLIKCKYHNCADND